MLVDMGFRVVAPDCLGYGRTVSQSFHLPPYWELASNNNPNPKDAPDDFTPYSHKSCAADIKALATHLGETQIILGGHDWQAFPSQLYFPGTAQLIRKAGAQHLPTALPSGIQS